MISLSRIPFLCCLAVCSMPPVSQAQGTPPVASNGFMPRDGSVPTVIKPKYPPLTNELGGDIYIHGNGASSDWTWGCVALENDDVRELFNAVPVGTPVRIER